MPSATRAVAGMGASGFMPSRCSVARMKRPTRPLGARPRNPGRPHRSVPPFPDCVISARDALMTSSGLLNKSRVGELTQIRNLLDHAGLQQQVGGLLVEGDELAGEERLVGGSVLPAQILRGVAELIARLLHVGAHDLVGLGLVALDHPDRVEIALHTT